MATVFAIPAPQKLASRSSSATLRGVLVILAIACISISVSAQAQTFTVIHTFEGPDGSTPNAGLFRDSAGNLYGTTSYGGAHDLGTVFKLDLDYNETVLYSFAGGQDGATPYGSVVADADGNLYGTTSGGGSPVCKCGTIFKLDPSGKETILYRFRGGSDGADPWSGLILDSAGNLFGTTTAGGTYNGTVFEVSAGGIPSILYRFSGGADGSTPLAGVIRDSAGNLYGTTYYGGTAAGMSGYGVVFQLAPNGVESVLLTFNGSNAGINPRSNLIFCGDAICGTAADAVFHVTETGVATSIYSFKNPIDGSLAWGGVLQTAGGIFYGTTSKGGLDDFGTFFRLRPSGDRTTLYTFTGHADGGYPQGNLVGDAEGNLYGTTSYEGDPSCRCGTIYKLTP